MIFVSLEDWDEIWRRNQFFCSELMQAAPGWRILFVSLPRDVTNTVRTGRWRRLFAKEAAIGEHESRITRLRPWKLFPNSLSAGRAMNEWFYRRQVLRAARRLGFAAPVLWINAHWAAHLAGKTGESALIYDVTDDWTALHQASKQAALTQRQDESLCRRADAVIVCSERLHEMKRKLSPHVHLVPNGVDADKYQRVLSGSDPLPSLVKDWKHPVYGYTGTVHPERVDLELVTALAGMSPESTVALIGPLFLSSAERQRLEALPNIKLVGPVAYAELPEMMRAFDVCITPHLVTDFTESLNPIKLWEYLAAGKPIVSTNVAGFRDYAHFVRVAHSAGEFADLCRDALQEDPSVGLARRAEARKHSWAVRVQEVRRLIAAAVARHEQRA